MRPRRGYPAGPSCLWNPFGQGAVSPSWSRPSWPLCPHVHCEAEGNAQMTCSEFVARLSEYLDGGASPEDLREAEKHLSACSSCRRYRDVVERGVELLRTLPLPEVPEDFGPRLQHRLYHVDAESVLGGPASSAAPGMTVLGMALLLAAVAWVPTLRPTAPEVELPVIEVSRPPISLRYRTRLAYPFRVDQESYGLGEMPHLVRPVDLWKDPPGRLFQYSILSTRVQRSSLQRTGVEEDH